jgi:hypothetical protein
VLNEYALCMNTAVCCCVCMYVRYVWMYACVYGACMYILNACLWRRVCVLTDEDVCKQVESIHLSPL